MLMYRLRAFAPSLFFGLVGALLLGLTQWLLSGGPLLLLPYPILLAAQFFMTSAPSRWMRFLQLLLTFFIAFGLDSLVFVHATTLVSTTLEIIIRGIVWSGIGILLAGLFATYSKPIRFS
jgi:hypothetical protein